MTKAIMYLDCLTAVFLLVALFGTSTTALYTKNSPVLQLSAKTYSSLVSTSNSTTILEFYAPWCGHCRNLAPQYEKAAESLKGMATVAAIDCDEDANKPFCGGMGIKGFPTLKIIKPAGKKGKKERIEDYNGPRTAKGIAETVREKMINYATRVKDSEWGSTGEEKKRALIVTVSGASAPPLVKSISTDFLDLIEIGWAKKTDKEVVERYGIKEFPAVIMLPGGDEQINYDGKKDKDGVVKFLSQWATPHPDPKTKLESLEKAKKESKSGKGKPKKENQPKVKPEAASETVSDPAESSPGPNVVEEDTPHPIQVPISKPEALTHLETTEALQRTCLHAKSGTCVLAILPPLQPTSEGEEVPQPEEPEVLTTLSQIRHKHTQRGAKIFPFYAISGAQDSQKDTLQLLGLEDVADSLQVVAVNGKKSWWSRYEGTELSRDALESWIDDIRMGEVKKNKFSEKVIDKIQKKAAGKEKANEPPSENHEEL